MTQKGKLIVIDGIDGTGKATQVGLLAGRLKNGRFKTKTIDFPRYYDNFFGKLVGECLAGKYGDFLSLDPRIASTLYAADRFESKNQINKWLEQGYLVIVDRYVSANQIHQGGKLTDGRKRAHFLRWLDKMEYKVFGIPRPDLIIYLDLPLELSQQLLDAKHYSFVLAQRKRYTKEVKDAHEASVTHLDQSRQSALRMVASKNKWIKIDCAPEGELLSKGEVHLLVLDAVARELGLTIKF